MPSAKVLFTVPETIDGLVEALDRALAHLDGDEDAEISKEGIRDHLAA